MPESDTKKFWKRKIAHKKKKFTERAVKIFQLRRFRRVSRKGETKQYFNLGLINISVVLFEIMNIHRLLDRVPILDHVGGVMDTMLGLSVVDHGFKPLCQN